MDSLQRLSVSLIFIIFCISASGGDPWRPSAGAGEAGSGYSCVMRNTFWSSFHNQAALAFNTSFSAGVNYENRFGIRELGSKTAAIVLPAGRASLGAVYSHFGYPDFRRHSAGLACGMKLAEKVAAGVQADYFLEKTYGEYSSYEALSIEAGLILSPSERVRIGIHVFNPVPGSVRKTFLPSRLRAGAGILLSEGLYAAAEAEMSTGGELVIRTGFDYEALKKLWLRGGFSTDNTSFCFGTGYRIGNLLIDLGFVTHDRLGITSSASMIFVLK